MVLLLYNGTLFTVLVAMQTNVFFLYNTWIMMKSILPFRLWSKLKYNSFGSLTQVLLVVIFYIANTFKRKRVIRAKRGRHGVSEQGGEPLIYYINWFFVFPHYRYSLEDGLLHVGIERARNLTALSVPEHYKVWVSKFAL